MTYRKSSRVVSSLALAALVAGKRKSAAKVRETARDGEKIRPHAGIASASRSCRHRVFHNPGTLTLTCHPHRID